jgi:mannan endo-1,4-beta-mannosidase
MPRESTFQVSGTKIYDPQGQEFIIKGINMFTWEGITQVDSLINRWGFNTVRVPNYLLGNYNQPHPAQNNYGTNHQIADAFTSQGAVVIFDAHDRIGGYYEGNEWEILKDYWRDMAQEFKDNPNVWFNLQNEPGNATANSAKWVAYHRELIDIIRGEGANNLIVVDGEAWGQDFPTQTIAGYADRILNNNQNVVFSIHAYDRWNNNDIASYLDELYVRDIPVIIGEYGSENAGQNTLNATIKTIAATQEREIGRIVWEANLTSGDTEDFNGTNPQVLTDLGQIVWQDLQRIEDLDPLKKNLSNDQNTKYSSGVFKVNKTGKIDYEFLFDGGWFQGELAVFNLEGMEAYTPGSQAFIQEAARRAQSNSNLGRVLIQDSQEKALFGQALPWEKDFNQGEYRGVRSFSMNSGDKFAFILTQNYTTAAIVNDPSQIWQPNQLPIFSIPEANPGGDLSKKDAKRTGQIVALNKNGVYGFEDMRIDWQQSDYDYNDFVFKLKGATGIAPLIDLAQNSQRRWQNTPAGQKLLKYSNGSLFEGVFAVNKSGRVDVDYLYDGGSYQGEIGLFSLSGLANLEVTSVEFRQEAIRRALTNSKQGYVILKDSIENPKFNDLIDSNTQIDSLTGQYKGIQRFSLNPGDLVGLVLNPKGTLEQLLNSPWSDNLRPFFSLAAANFDRVQTTEINGSSNNTILGWEDIGINLGADRDYNDIVIGLEGVDSIGVPDFRAYVNSNLNWLQTPIGQDIFHNF